MLTHNLSRLFSRKHQVSWLSALCFTVLSQTAAAVPYPNPLPAALQDDLDSTGYFNTAGVASVAFELFDLGDTIAEFGFYEQGNSGVLNPIFEASDLVGNAAIIDFTAGFVIDFDLAAVQNLFTAPTNPIGFYLSIPNLPVFFSDPTLNPGGLDYTAEHVSIAQDSLDVLFWTPSIPGAAPSELLSWHRITGVTGVPVPNPSSIALVLLGLAAMSRRKIRN